MFLSSAFPFFQFYHNSPAIRFSAVVQTDSSPYDNSPSNTPLRLVRSFTLFNNGRIEFSSGDSVFEHNIELPKRSPFGLRESEVSP